AREAAPGRAADLRAARRRGLQAPRDCEPARDLPRHLEGATAPRADDAEKAPETMTPDPFAEQLSDYLDDELSAGERASVERHLAECAACRRTLGELREVVRRASALDDSAPDGDLWAGVAARLERPRFAASRVRRVVSFTLPQLAAASLTLMVLSGGLVW